MNRSERRAQAKTIRKQGDAVTPEQLGALQEAGTLLQAGAYSPCRSLCERVLAQSPGQRTALYLLALSLVGLAERDKAEAVFRTLVGLHPAFADGCHQFANFLLQQKRFPEAIQFYRKAIVANPAYPDPYTNLGRTLMLEEKKYEEALSCFRKAILLLPEDDNHWLNYHEAMEHLPSLRYDAPIIPLLVKRFPKPSHNAMVLTYIGTECFLAHPQAKSLSTLLHQPGLFKAALREEDNLRLLLSPLLLGLLEYQIMTSDGLEFLLTAIRRHLLEETFGSTLTDKDQTKWLPFVQALSHQCFRNEYVYYLSQEEQDWLADLRARVEKIIQIDKADPAQRWNVLLYSCYDNLYRLPNAEVLNQAPGDDAYSALLRRQVGEPLEERAISKNIPVFGSITDTVSQEVRDQYEANPYPRWQSLEMPTPKLLKDVFRQQFPAINAKVLAGLPDKPDILIAGCGAGRHALEVAYLFKDSRVLAIDLSRASLAYAIRKQRELACTSVEFMQADILSLDTLDRDFDVIDSVGVLHHMKDPVAGWKILTSKLRPKGVLKVGLYSEIARKTVVEMRSLIAQKKYPSTPEGIRQCRLHIMQRDMPGKGWLLGIQDFFMLSECRDLLFHVQEHRFTLLQIARILDDLGLEFLGFNNLRPSTIENYRRLFPQDIMQNSLKNWHLYEQQHPATFMGMYHLWLCKRS